MTEEKTPRPATGAKVFVIAGRVRFHEVDGLGHVNNASYLNYMEQAAIDHALFVGLDLGRLQTLGGIFVARRHEIDFWRSALAGELLKIVTWLDAARGARINRHYLIYRDSSVRPPSNVFGELTSFPEGLASDSLLVSATTEWVFVSSSGRPRRIPEEIHSAFNARGGIG